jgi:hypothetical protein
MVTSSLYCPVVEYRDVLPHQSITHLDVFGNRNTSSDILTTVKACKANTSTNGGSCGTAATTGSAGAWVLSPSVSAWSSSSGVAYVQVFTTGTGSLRGFSIDDN